MQNASEVGTHARDPPQRDCQRRMEAESWAGLGIKAARWPGNYHMCIIRHARRQRTQNMLRTRISFTWASSFHLLGGADPIN